MNKSNIEKIADNWIKVQLSDSYSDSALDLDLPFNHPNLCFNVILNILEKIDTVPDNKLFSVLAAGPLDDLLHEHGSVMIDKIDTTARINPKFRKLLNGVWDSELDNSIKNRLSKYMVDRW